jgi:hypothetical protein
VLAVEKVNSGGKISPREKPVKPFFIVESIVTVMHSTG